MLHDNIIFPLLFIKIKKIRWVLIYHGKGHPEYPGPLAANIGKELRPSIPLSALRAPSSHVWGEGNKEEVHWEGLGDSLRQPPLTRSCPCQSCQHLVST